MNPITDQDAYTAARTTLHRVGTHVLGRRRFGVVGRFGLRASPGGLATPAFGDEPEIVRIDGVSLIREVGGVMTQTAINGATLRDLATFAGVDIDRPFSAGGDTPAVGDPDGALVLDATAARTIAEWYALGWRVMDDVIAELPPTAEPATIQLWPEHFDAGTNVGLASGERVNLGCSPGDAFEPQPYLYVGPWSADRRGDQAFWNAPFGAILRAADLVGADDAARVGGAFLRAGLRHASGDHAD